jgi:hypothetical protein
LPALSALDWRSWNGEVVLRVASSGSTHLLTPLASALWLTLVEAGTTLTTRELGERWLRGNLSLEDEAAIDAVLADLQQMGMVECAA